jgi:plastocyanin
MLRSSVRRVAAVAGAIAATAGVGACSNGRPAATIPAVQHVTVDATDMLRFAPSTITVHPGTVVITLVSAGSYPHNLSLPELHAQSRDVSGLPGQSRATLTVAGLTPGTYTFVCTYHDSAGMRGQLVVRR